MWNCFWFTKEVRLTDLTIYKLHSFQYYFILLPTINHVQKRVEFPKIIETYNFSENGQIGMEKRDPN